MDFSSHSLWQQIVKTTGQALKSGALQPISTQLQILSDGELQFYVRVLDNLVRKEAAKKSQKLNPDRVKPNPFLPYEEALCVTHLSDTHVCLLNKFNVVDHHILMVTREYESQDSWLTYADFQAFVHCVMEVDGLGFYNGGQQAGASQHHKHLQLVPFSEERGMYDLPLAKLIQTQKDRLKDSKHLNILPFHHGIQLLEHRWIQEAALDITNDLFKTYQQLMTVTGISLDQPKPPVPYNLLLTREWMMIVPRSQESYQDIGVNSLGYSGWLLVKTVEELKKLEEIGPLNLLKQVGKPL
ncbi:MAG: phosphorylase [Leptolyngbya sp. SIO1D8]|nr:phosphorylase [Leptolyngbya sp. SIO1D8]